MNEEKDVVDDKITEIMRRVDGRLKTGDQPCQEAAARSQGHGMIVFLQNAWSGYYAGREWPRASWLRALRACPTGRRLARLMNGVEYEPYNTTPICGDSPSSIVPPDEDHIKKLLNGSPVVACGKQAEILTRLWDGPLLIVPHPAARGLSNNLLDYGNQILLGGLSRRVKLTGKSQVVEKNL